MSATQIVLLTQDYQFLNLVSIKKCIKLVCKGRVEVIKESDKQLRAGFLLPSVIRLIKAIKVNVKKFIPFSKQNVFIRDEYKCGYCDKELNAKTATVDHIIPQSRGGKNTYLNTICACRFCNQTKADYNLSDTDMRIKRKPYHPSFSDFLYLKAKSMGVNMAEIFA